MNIIMSKIAPAVVGAYSQAILSGDKVFTSGQIPLLPKTGELIAGGIREQTQQVVKNLQAVLIAANSSLDNVVKATCFLTDMHNFAAFNEVYADYFIGKPARSCVAVLALPKGALVEIEVIAEVINK